MLNGAKPASRPGSVKVLANEADAKLLLNMSIVPAEKVPVLLLPIASPLWTALAVELSTCNTALVPAAHAEMVSSSVAKTKRAGVPGETVKPVAVLNT